MAAHMVLLFLLFCKCERQGISGAVSEGDQDSLISNKRQEVLLHEPSMGNVFTSIKELENQLRNKKGDKKNSQMPNVAFRLNDRAPNEFYFKSNMASQHSESAAKSPIPKHSPEVTVNQEKSSSLTNGEVEGVINDNNLVLSSGEQYTLQPELHLETGVGDVLPERQRGCSKWVTESEDSQSGPRSRCRRSWLWNQFFVIEEYRGPEPVLIGRCPHQQPSTAFGVAT